MGKNIRPHNGCQGFPCLFSVLWNERLSYMGKKKQKKSEPPMWPVVDHTHIPRDLSLPSVNGGRAIHGPCHLLNNSDAESLWGGLHNSTWSFHFLESLGTRGGWESHPVKQESCGECTLPSSCNGTSHPGHQCLWFAFSFLNLSGNTHENDQGPSGTIAAHSCSQVLNMGSFVQLGTCSSLGHSHSLAKSFSGMGGVNSSRSLDEGKKPCILLSLT